MYSILIEDKTTKQEIITGLIETAGETKDILRVLNRETVFGNPKNYCIWVLDADEGTIELGSDYLEAMF